MKKILYWLPRVLAVLLTVFIGMFALDVFSEGYSVMETIVALLIHLVPVYILAVVTAIAWKWENIGGLIFITLGIFYIMMTAGKEHIITIMIVAGIPLLIGVLFLAQKFFEKK